MHQISKQQCGADVKPRQACNKAEQEDDDGGSAPSSEANLDSGYAWVILVVMFLLQSIISGSNRLYGLVYAKEVEIGYYDRQEASWPIATASAVENLAGILSPALVQWLSWRNLQLASSATFVLANVIGYLSNSLALDILALGIIQGLALSVCTVMTLLINNDYFDRYRTSAYGLSMCGSTFGLLYLGPIVSWLLNTYANFRLVYLALACAFSFNLILALFIRPRSEAPDMNDVGRFWRQLTKRSSESSSTNGSLAANKNNNKAKTDASAAAGRKRSRLESQFLERRDSVASISYMARSRRNSALSKVVPAELSKVAAGSQQRHLCQQLRPALAKSKSGVELANRFSSSGGGGGGAQRLVDNEALIKKISVCSARGWPSTNTQQPPTATTATNATDERQLLAHARSQTSLATISRASSLIGPQLVGLNDKGALSQTDLEAASAELDVASLYRRLALEHEGQVQGQDGLTMHSKLDLKQDELTNDNKLKQQEQQQSFSLANLVKLLSLPYLHCTWIMLAIYYLVARIYVIILVDFGRDHGLDMAEATSLLNYWSFGELLGRLFLGSLVDLRFLSCRACIGLTCALLAGVICWMVYVESYLVYIIGTMLVAALVSLEYMLINVMMVEYIGKHMVTNCYSLAACIASLVLFCRPTLIGLFRDFMGSYDGLLLTLAGVSGTFALLFYLIEPILVRRWPKSVG